MGGGDGQAAREAAAGCQVVLDRHEAAGTTDDPGTKKLRRSSTETPCVRVEPWPECVLRSFQFIAEPGVVYHTMNGPSEFHVTGNLREWSVVERLPEISVPRSS